MRSVNFGDSERQEILLITGQTFDLILLPHIVLNNQLEKLNK